MVKLRFDTDMGNTLKVTSDLDAAIAKISKTVQGTTREMNALEKAAKRIADANLTPQEKYNRALETMAKAVKAGKMSMEDAEKAARRLSDRLDETTHAGDKSFGASALSGIKSYVMGLASVGTAVALVRSELEALQVESEKRTQAHLSAASARDQLKRNIAPAGAAAGRKIESRADALAAELGLPQAKVDVALAEAFSSSENEDQAFSRVRVAAGFLKTRPEGIGAFTGALGDISKATKDQNDLRNLGFLINVSARSRVADDQKFSETFPVAAAGMSSFGAKAEEAGAFFDALGIATADNEGRITGTGGIQLASQLAEKVKGNDFGSRLQSLWDNPQAAKKFVDDASFESKVKGPMQELLLNKDSPIAKQYREMLGGFGTAEGQVAKAKETAAYLDEGRTANTAAVERVVGAKIEQFQLGQDAELSNESREKIIERNRQLTGNLALANRFATFYSTGATMSPSEAISELEAGLKTGGSTTFGNELPSEALIENTKQMILELQKLNDQRTARPSGRQE